MLQKLIDRLIAKRQAWGFQSTPKTKIYHRDYPSQNEERAT